MTCKEGLRHLLQVGVHRVSEIVGDVLGYPAVQVAFKHPDQVRSERDGKREQDQGDEGTEVPADQAFVDDPAGQDGRCQAEHR